MERKRDVFIVCAPLEGGTQFTEISFKVGKGSLKMQGKTLMQKYSMQ